MNIINFTKKITFSLLTILLLSNCSVEDINTNPFSATKIDPSLLLPEIIYGGLSSNRTAETVGMFSHSQVWSAVVGFGVFTGPERYTISSTTTNNLWVFQQTTSLRNLKQIRSLTEESNPTARNIIGQAKTLEAFSYLYLTQIFEEIPFSQSLNVDEFPTPVFDTQEDVLRGVVERATEAAAELKTDTDIITSGDLIYNGDRELWLRFANSIKLKALMLIANVDPSSVQQEIENVSKELLITNNSQAALVPYFTNAGNENSIWKVIDQYNGQANDFWGAGKPLVKLMNDNEDPRRPVYFDDVDGDYIGQDQGVFNTDGVSRISLNIIKADMPDIYISASEVNFYLAEAALKGWISGNAENYYKEGISQSLNFYDSYETSISSKDKGDYLSSRGVLDGSEEDNLIKIHEEAYIANVSRALEAWTNWRRNKVPELDEPTGAVLNDVIRRYSVPLSEETTNPNAVITTDLTKPMWFEK